jgi:hypothetical protein
VLQLRIRLEDITPIIWRRVLVPGGVHLSKFHDMIQMTMGWTDSHLHSFTIGGQLYGMHFDDWPEEEIDETTVKLLHAVGDQRRFTYEYDFGDSWTHEVVVERTTTVPFALKFAVCLDGQNACPPEDVGGSYGYDEFRQAIADATHEEHESWLTWAGGSFDPAEFDLVMTNIGLQRLR